MTLSASWGRRLRVALAVLVLAPSLVLATGAAEAEAATSWKNVAAGSSTGWFPIIALAGETKVDPSSFRIQVTNHAAKKREIAVAWSRICWDKNFNLLEAEGEYIVKPGSGKTHTKKIKLPKKAIECDLIVAVMGAPSVRGKVSVKMQSAH